MRTCRKDVLDTFGETTFSNPNRAGTKPGHDFVRAPMHLCPQVDAYLAAVGRVPNSAQVEALGVELDEYGCVRVGPKLETSVRARDGGCSRIQRSQTCSICIAAT